jgi:hypothetical protein
LYLECISVCVCFLPLLMKKALYASMILLMSYVFM